MRKCNLPLTSLSAHQQILHHLHHFLGHNLRCALTISQRLPRKQLPVSPRGFKRLRSKSSCGHCPGPNWSLSDARITCNPTRDESTYVAQQCPKSLDRLVVSVSTCAKNISHFGSTSQVPWKKATTLNSEPPSAASSEKLLGSALDHLEIPL